MKIEAKIRFKNRGLLDLINRAGFKTIKDFSIMSGINPATISTIINLKHNFTEDTKERLTDFLISRGAERDEINNALLGHEKAVEVFGEPRVVTKEIDTLRLEDVKKYLINDPTDNIRKIENKIDADKIMKIINYKYKNRRRLSIWKTYYGLDGYEQKNMEEISKEYLTEICLQL